MQMSYSQALHTATATLAVGKKYSNQIYLAAYIYIYICTTVLHVASVYYTCSTGPMKRNTYLVISVKMLNIYFYTEGREASINNYSTTKLLWQFQLKWKIYNSFAYQFLLFFYFLFLFFFSDQLEDSTLCYCWTCSIKFLSKI